MHRVLSFCIGRIVKTRDNYKIKLKKNQAQIAVMRKIIITAHSLYKNDRKYDVNFGKPKATYVE